MKRKNKYKRNISFTGKNSQLTQAGRSMLFLRDRIKVTQRVSSSIARSLTQISSAYGNPRREHDQKSPTCPKRAWESNGIPHPDFGAL